MLLSLSIIFVIGYVLIACEQLIRVNKAAVALITGAICWFIFFNNTNDSTAAFSKLLAHTGDFSSILFFLMAAMTIVELIDTYDGFSVMTKLLATRRKLLLLWLISIITFFFSAILDNMTTAIVMTTLMLKIVKERSDKIYFTGMIVIASNAGGAWSPIGDVTTTMLWIGGNISSWGIIRNTFFASLVNLVIPLLFASYVVRGTITSPDLRKKGDETVSDKFERWLIFILGMMTLVSVPVLKAFYQIPPYIGILLGLSIMWIVIELIHFKKPHEEKHELSVAGALQRIDLPTILFFLGILLAVAALESVHLLEMSARLLEGYIHSSNIIVILLGLISAVIDNVPLVAAMRGMYPLTQFPMDHPFWLFTAYCTGTGGSLLIIGSAAGVAAMGIARVTFFEYLRTISVPALLGYFGGVICFLIEQGLIWGK